MEYSLILGETSTDSELHENLQTSRTKFIAVGKHFQVQKCRKKMLNGNFIL